MKNIMKEAHNLTKRIIRKGDSYKATFRLCLIFVHSQIKKVENKMVELKGTEKQITFAEELRKNYSMYIEIGSKLFAEFGTTELIEEELEDNNFKSVEEAFNTLAKTSEASKIIKALKNRKEAKKYDKEAIEREYTKAREQKRFGESPEVTISHIIMIMGDIKNA